MRALVLTSLLSVALQASAAPVPSAHTAATSPPAHVQGTLQVTAVCGVGVPVVSTTPDRSYGVREPCHPGFYQVEATHTEGWTIALTGILGDSYGPPQPANQQACAANILEVEFWGYDTGGWHQIAAITGPGSWNVQTGKCDSFASRRVYQSPYSKLRVMVKGRTGTGPNAQPLKVTGRINNEQW